MSVDESDKQSKKLDSLLSGFFQSERPQTWPQPPWRKPAESTRTYRRSWGKLAGLAALLLASVGLSCLSDGPGTWPENANSKVRGQLEAKRKAPVKKSAKLPGTSVPETSKPKATPR